jgi:murein DD-endopeptidase MepM/ murein hydrolase activator NlpD
MYLDKPMPLRSQHRRQRRGPSPSRGSSFIVVLGLVAVNYFLFFASDDAPPLTLQERLQAPVTVNPGDAPAGTEGFGAPTSPEQPAGLPGTPQPTPSGQPAPSQRELDDFGQPVGRKVAGALQRGQTLLRALRAEGVDNRSAVPLTQAMEKVFDFRTAQVGDAFDVWLDDEGQVRHLRYTQSALDRYEVDLADTGAYVARKVAVPTDISVAHVGCAIKSSLYGSIARCGEGSQLGGLIIDLFAWDIDFFQDVRPDDTFRVIVEKISVEGKFLAYGKILAAEYDGKFGRHRIVYYTDAEGASGYYTADGRAVRKEFLKSPLKYTRVSADTETGMHAQLTKASPVVYTAAAGTQVWAVASGTVVFAGESGSLGTAVTIKHDNGYTSTYGHLGRLGGGIKVGALVNQKSIIGHVGQSGKTSQPKLLFSLRQNGKLVNPLKLKFAEADPVPAERHDHFEHEVQTLLRDLEATPVVGTHERRS